ncbi:hypothetical protein F511_29112 [Dorcoceras hygrometricum]|uniref:Uncharacterized protein n=1 Tax=Dorcoceras hygrometricum TaxID=472368 RepID=A0A2Z7CEE3_9LAMI|nr:hypothetical protein F511_29112 [Dorcoceras hygrometricum]
MHNSHLAFNLTPIPSYIKLRSVPLTSCATITTNRFYLNDATHGRGQQLRGLALANDSLQEWYRKVELLKRSPTLPRTHQTKADNDGNSPEKLTVNSTRVRRIEVDNQDSISLKKLTSAIITPTHNNRKHDVTMSADRYLPILHKYDNLQNYSKRLAPTSFTSKPALQTVGGGRSSIRSTTGIKIPPSICTRRSDGFWHGRKLLVAVIETSLITYKEAHSGGKGRRKAAAGGRVGEGGGRPNCRVGG